VGFAEIGEVKRAGETGWASADNEDVGFELFALDGHVGFILSDRHCVNACAVVPETWEGTSSVVPHRMAYGRGFSP
jgi:hypothetical protein